MEIRRLARGRFQTDALPTVPITVKRDNLVGHVSCCPALDIFSQGPTEEIARHNLCDALRLFIKSCYLRGTLDRVFKDCGFEPDNEPILFEDSMSVVQIPLSLIAHAEVDAG